MLKQTVKRLRKQLSDRRSVGAESVQSANDVVPPPPRTPPPSPIVRLLDDEGKLTESLKDVIVQLVVDHNVPETRALGVVCSTLSNLAGVEYGRRPSDSKHAAEQALSEVAEAEEIRTSVVLARACGWTKKLPKDGPDLTPRSCHNLLVHPRASRVLACESDKDGAVEPRELFPDTPPPPPPPPPAEADAKSDADTDETHDENATHASGDAQPRETTTTALDELGGIEDAIDDAREGLDGDYVRQHGCGYITISTDGSSAVGGPSSLSVVWQHDDQTRPVGLLDLPTDKTAPAILESIERKINDVRARQKMVGVERQYRLTLYDIHAWGVDNEGANKGASKGLLALVADKRRTIYQQLCKSGLRGVMGKFVPLVTLPCNLHISNLIDVGISKRWRQLDLADGVPESELPCRAGDVESLTYCYVRRLMNTARASLKFKVFRAEHEHDRGRVPRMCISRFWSVLRGACFLASRRSIFVRFRVLCGSSDLDTFVDTYEKYVDRIDFDVLLMAVARHGIHKPFTLSAANNTLEEHVAVARALFDQHERALNNEEASQEWWVTELRKLPVALKCSASVLACDTGQALNDGQRQRIRAVHESVVECLERHFDAFLFGDRALQQASVTRAARFETFGCERDFRDVQYLQRRNRNMSNGKLSAYIIARRVGSARFSWKGCGVIMDEVFKAPWALRLKSNLAPRARNLCDKIWIRAQARNKEKLEWMIKQCQERTAAEEEKALNLAHKDGKWRSVQGGFVGEGQKRKRVPAGRLVSKHELGSTSLDDKEALWTVPALKAQLHLRGLDLNGVRAELVKRLMDALDEEDEREFTNRRRLRQRS